MSNCRNGTDERDLFPAQSPPHSIGATESPERIWRHRTLDHLGKCRIDVWTQFLHRRWTALDDGKRQWHYVLLRERLSTRQRLISNDADRIEIVINGCRLAANPVGTHVRQRADDMTSRRVDRRSGLHNSEIGNFDGAR